MVQCICVNYSHVFIKAQNAIKNFLGWIFYFVSKSACVMFNAFKQYKAHVIPLLLC